MAFLLRLSAQPVQSPGPEDLYRIQVVFPDTDPWLVGQVELRSKDLVGCTAGFAPAFRGYEPFVLSYATTAPEISIRRWKWSGWQELNLRGHAPKACGWPLPYTRHWWLGTELNRIHWLFRPALCRRVPEPNLVDGARIELAFHGCRPWVIPLYERPIWGEMRESNSRDRIHNQQTAWHAASNCGRALTVRLLFPLSYT